MPRSEFTPEPHNETHEFVAGHFPHYDIRGFDKLPTKVQNLYLKIPASRLEAARSIIEREIAKVEGAHEKRDNGEAKTFQSRTIESKAIPRKEQATAAIETFHSAKVGDPDAKKNLLDQKRELSGEELDDDEIFTTLLESQSSNPFARDTVLEVMLSDEQAEAHQDVLDLFNEFRGDLPSADDALNPEFQIRLFLKLTESGGALSDRLFLLRQMLGVVTDHGRLNLFTGLHNQDVLKDGELDETAIKAMVANTKTNAGKHA